MSEVERVRFTTSLRREDYEELVRAANLAERSLLAEASLRLRSTLGERGGVATAARGDSVEHPRSPSVALGEGAAVGRTPPVASSPSVAPIGVGRLCDKTGLLLADCLCAEHKGMS